MPLGLKCQIQILEDRIDKTRKFMSTAESRYTKRLEKMEKNLIKLKEKKNDPIRKSNKKLALYN